MEPQAAPNKIQKVADASNVVALRPANQVQAESGRRRPQGSWKLARLAVERDWAKSAQESAEEQRDALIAEAHRLLALGAPAPTAAAAASSETIATWFGRYFAWKRKVPGKNGSVRQDESRFRAWIAPRIGQLPIAAPRETLADAIEELRDDLDDAVRAYVEHGKGAHKDKSRTSGKNAAQIWGVLVTGLNYASTAAKRSGLRVRSDNPCDNIRAPEKSPDKYKTVLRPIEFIALAACDEVPREWRETYAVALYVYARPGELRVLTWNEVDFTTNQIRINRAWDYEDQTEKPTKTWETRDVPIEPTLRPLLVAMRERSGGKGLVLPMLSSLADETAISKVFRRHLEAAGVTRPDLFTASTTQIAIRFRSLRDTGITWRLWRGDNPFVVQRNAGHKRFSTTEKYIGDVEKLTAACGEPFPALPSGLTGAEAPGPAPVEGTPPLGCERRDLKPNGPAGEPPSQGDDVEATLALALRAATAAGQWAAVTELARALATRRVQP